MLQASNLQKFRVLLVRIIGAGGWLPVLFLAACASTEEVAVDCASMDHSGHAGHMAHNMAPDELGRQLYGMQHEMSPEAVAEMRARNIFPPGTTDQQINGMMRAMGSNYAWYVSGAELQGDTGLLLLAHGFGDHGDQTLYQQMQPVGEDMPAALAFGMSMAMSDHIQVAIDDLTAAGAEQIIVIPAASSRYSTLMRQWEYIFAVRDEPAYATVPRICTNASVEFVVPLEDHPLVAEILTDHAAEISKDPAREEIILVAHGPLDAEDNRLQLETMERLGEKLLAQGYAGFWPVTLQDDAPKEVRNANVQRMRGLVEEIDARGNKTLVITNLLGTRTVQRSIRRDLNGLGYRYNFKGLVQHENFVEWVRVSAMAARQ